MTKTIAIIPPRTAAERAGHAVAARLQQAGHQAWIVGGAIRDRLLMIDPHDSDVATDAIPSLVLGVFGDQARMITHKMSLVSVIQDGQEVQVATFREGSDPGVRWSLSGHEHAGKTPEEDATHRDFTINQIFYDPVRHLLLDRFGGMRDLEDKVVRAVGDPGVRISEDWLRGVRAVRFAIRLGFTIDPATAAAIRSAAPNIMSLRGPRVFDEITKVITGPMPGEAVRLLDEMGILRAVLPEVCAGKGVEQPAVWHPEGDVWKHTVLTMSSLPIKPDPRLAWAVLLHDVGKPPTAKAKPDGVNSFPGHSVKGAEMSSAILERLSAPIDFAADVRRMIRHHMDFAMIKRMKKATIRRMSLRPTLELELELHRCDCTGRADLIAEFEETAKMLRVKAEVPAPLPLVTGTDVLALGVQPGPLVGKVLRIVRDLQFGERIKTREEALARLPGLVRGQQGAAGTGSP